MISEQRQFGNPNWPFCRIPSLWYSREGNEPLAATHHGANRPNWTLMEKLAAATSKGSEYKSMNTTVTSALAAANAARQSAVITKAQSIIGYILEEKAKIARYSESKKLAQDEILKIGDDVISYATVVGGTAPTTPNANQATILNAIKEANDARQKQVEAKAKIQLNNIDSLNKSIAGCEARIAELREEMGKLEADVLTEASIIQ